MEQREIKFRGLRSDNGEWVTGSYHCCKGSAILHSHDYFGKPKERDVVLNKHWILTHNLPSSPGWTISDTYLAFSVLPESVGQYTGRKDRVGNEIYVGDIMGNEMLRCWVEENEDGSYVLRFRDGRIKPISILDHKVKMSIVKGNVHQNPELLNPS